jgi:hypothetical protein
MGYDPEHKAKIAEVHKQGWPPVRHLVSGQPADGFHSRKDHLQPHQRHSVLWNENWFCGVAWFFDDGAAQHPIRQAAVETVLDQHWLLAGVLSRDGGDSWEVGGVLKGSAGILPAVAKTPRLRIGGCIQTSAATEAIRKDAYSISKPPVSSDNSWMLCSTQ